MRCCLSAVARLSPLTAPWPAALSACVAFEEAACCESIPYMKRDAARLGRKGAQWRICWANQTQNRRRRLACVGDRAMVAATASRLAVCVDGARLPALG